MSVTDYTVTPDMSVFSVNVRNDGDVPLNITGASLRAGGETFLLVPGHNMTFLNAGPSLQPGDVASLWLDVAGGPHLADGSSVYLTIFGGAVSRTFQLIVQ